MNFIKKALRPNTAQNETKIPERFPSPAAEQFLHLGEMHDLQIRAIITFQGRLNADRLARAIRLTLDIEPVLGCVFHPHALRPHWKRHHDLNTTPFFSAVRTSDLKKDIHMFMGAPLDPCTDIQIQARLFHSGHDTLCIKINHMVADGSGVMDYITLLSDTYRKLEEDPGYLPRPNLKSRRGQRQVLRHIRLGSLLRACRHFSVPRSNGGFPVTSSDFSGRAFVFRRIEPDRYARIRKYGQARGTSMNDVLLAAFYRSLFKVLDAPPDMPLPVVLTVNLRRHIPSHRAEAICNLTGVFFPVLERRDGDTFDDTLAKVHRITQTAKKNHPWLAEVLYLELAFLFGYTFVHRLLRFAKKRRLMSDNLHPFTNIGMIHPERIDFGGIDVADFYTFGPVSPPPLIVLGMMTFKGTLTITLSYCDTATDGKIIHAFLDQLVGELPA